MKGHVLVCMVSVILTFGTGCNNDPDFAPSPAPSSELEITLTWPDSNASYFKPVDTQEEEASISTIDLVGSNEDGQCVIQGAFPTGQNPVRLPGIDCTGTFSVSGRLSFDNRIFVTCDYLQNSDFDCTPPYMGLDTGQVNSMHLVLYEYVSISSQVGVSSEISLAINLTPEHQSFFENLSADETSIKGEIVDSGEGKECLLGDMLSTDLQYNGQTGSLEWHSQSEDPFEALLPGGDCLFLLEVSEHGVQRMIGETGFMAPAGEVSLVDLGYIDLFLVDAQTDATLQIYGESIEINFNIELFTDWLDAITWSGQVFYNLRITGEEVEQVLALDRELNGLYGALDLEEGLYDFRLEIGDDLGVLLQGNSPVLIDSTSMGFPMELNYEVSGSLEGSRWAEISFSSRLSDDETINNGVRIAVVSTDGFESSCDTGEKQAYVCQMYVPVGEQKFSANYYYVGEEGSSLGYGAESHIFYASSISSQSLDMVMLHPIGSD